MAEKRYRLTAAAQASWWFSNPPVGVYQFRTGWTTDAPGGGIIMHNPAGCPVVDVQASDVIGTTNEGAQDCMEIHVVPKGIAPDAEAGKPVFELTTDPVTIDLDSILPGV